MVHLIICVIVREWTIDEFKNIYYLNNITPDEQLCIMYICKNLMVHRGGFNVIGAIICTNKLYANHHFIQFYTNKLKNILNEQNKTINFINEDGSFNVF